jgi:hypothetical protein
MWSGYRTDEYKERQWPSRQGADREVLNVEQERAKIRLESLESGNSELWRLKSTF